MLMKTCSCNQIETNERIKASRCSCQSSLDSKWKKSAIAKSFTRAICQSFNLNEESEYNQIIDRTRNTNFVGRQAPIMTTNFRYTNKNDNSNDRKIDECKYVVENSRFFYSDDE